jgi:hypothetical protein
MATCQGLFRPKHQNGDYSLVVELRFVEPAVRVRFPLVAQISQPESVSFRAVAVWSD